MTAVDHDTASRLDFVEGVRAYNYTHHIRELVDSYPRRVSRNGVEPTTWQDVAELYDTDPAYLLACGVQRTMQQIGWDTATASLAGDRADFMAQLDNADDAGPAQLVLDPQLALPDWYTEHTRTGRDDIHLVRGGYWGDPLVGHVYERGGAVYRLAWRAGYDARPGALEAFASLAPGETSAVIDIGCAFGGLTRVFARVFPDAHVTGIDLSAPALRYAHMLTNRAGLEVNYRQCDAEHTGLPSDSVDVVTAFLLLHEVPTDVRRNIMAEALRLLRPGGTLLLLDIPPYSAMSLVEGWFQSFDDRGNGENFWNSFLDSDFPKLLRSVGFIEVHDGPLEFPDPAYWGSAALWRTGDFKPVNRWVTTARKPAQKENPTTGSNSPSRKVRST